MASSGSFNTSGYEGRYLQFSWSISSQSVANNQTTISWTLKGAGTAQANWYKAGNFKVVINGTTVYSSSTRIQLYNGTTVASGNFTITHNSDGNKTFSASAEAGIYYTAVNCSGSGSWALTQIPRYATLTNAPNFNDTQNPTITYSNPAGTAVSSLQACISLTGSNADISYRDISKTGTSYTFNLTEAERNVLRAATPNSNTLSVKFYVKTVIGGNTNYSILTKTMTIINGNPTFNNPTYSDTNSTTVAITQNNQYIIQGKSTLQVKVTNASALKYATLRTATLTLNGVPYTENFGNNNYVTFNIGTVDIAQNETATVVVTDSRGNKTTKNLTIQFLSWALPYANVELYRVSNYYTLTNLTVNATYSSLNNKNSITIQYQICKTTDETWSSLTTIQNGVQTQFNADNNYSWYVKIIIKDKIGTTTYIASLNRGTPIIFFDNRKNSTGINCFPTYYGSLEVNSTGNQPSKYYGYAGASVVSVSSRQYTVIDVDGYSSNVEVDPAITIDNANSTIVANRVGIYRITYYVEWADVSSNNVCGVGVSINKNTNSMTPMVWQTNCWKLTQNGSFILDVTDAGATINPLVYSNSATSISQIGFDVELLMT